MTPEPLPPFKHACLFLNQNYTLARWTAFLFEKSCSMLLIIFHIIFSSIANLNVHTLSMFRVNLFNEKKCWYYKLLQFLHCFGEGKKVSSGEKIESNSKLVWYFATTQWRFFLFHEFTSKAELSRNSLPRKIYRSSPLITQYLTIFRSSSLAHLTPLGSKSFFNCLKHSVLIIEV